MIELAVSNETFDIDPEPSDDFLKIIDDIKNSDTDYPVFIALKNAVKRFNQSSFMVFDLPIPSGSSLCDWTMITNHSPDFMRTFSELEIPEYCSAFQALASRSAPIIWSLDAEDSIRGNGETMREFLNSFGFREAVLYPFQASDGRKTVICFSGKEPADMAATCYLFLISSHVFEYVVRKRTQMQTKLNLTSRELDCLFWTAKGKTSEELGIILDISANTVNHYIGSAASKLNSVNKTQAVAKAISKRIIALDEQ